jgi:hypothetical protein
MSQLDESSAPFAEEGERSRSCWWKKRSVASSEGWAPIREMLTRGSRRDDESR